MKKRDTELLKAVEAHDLNAVEKLVESGADVNCMDREGWTPLMAATPKIAIMKYLLEQGADWTAADNGAMDLAAKSGEVDAVQLLCDFGATIEDRNRDGRTPLFWAANWENISLMKYLLDQGAEVDAVDDLECTPLMLAGEKTLPLLLEAGADPYLLDSEGYDARDFIEGQIETLQRRRPSAVRKAKARLKIINAYTPAKVAKAQKKRAAALAKSDVPTKKKASKKTVKVKVKKKSAGTPKKKKVIATRKKK